MATEVTEQNFETEVLQESEKRPVLVDFWAEWCGPCRMLGPVLEKLEKDYKGRFKLVKVNTDLAQSLAMQYRISGIPAVKLFAKRQLKDEFTGALPESAVRRFLDSNISDPGLEALSGNPFEAALKALKLESAHPDRWKIMKQGALDGLASARADETVVSILEALQSGSAPDAEFCRTLLEFMKKYAPSSAERNSLGKTIVGDPAGLEHLLGRVAENKDNKEVREDFLLALKLFPDADRANQYRRQLSSLLF